MPDLRFSQIDVFGASAFGGNPVAVVHNADSLSDAELESFARWTNLSETTFLLSPSEAGADYRLRIFTPTAELPFAGHPTLGSAHAWLSAGGVPSSPGRVIQECIAGLITVRRSESNLAFAAPPCTRTGPVDEPTLERVAAGLETSRSQLLTHQWVDNGPGWLVVEVASVNELRALQPSAEALAGLDVGAFAICGPGSEHAYEIRAFVPGYSDCEDPVTGSLNASVAQWLLANRRVPASYTVGQGASVGRHGVVSIDCDGVDIWVGGRTITVIEGQLKAR